MSVEAVKYDIASSGSPSYSAGLPNAPNLYDGSVNDTGTSYNESSNDRILAYIKLSGASAVDQIRYTGKVTIIGGNGDLYHSSDGSSWTLIATDAIGSGFTSVNRTGLSITDQYFCVVVRDPGLGDCYLSDFRLYNGGTEITIGTSPTPPIAGPIVAIRQPNFPVGGALAAVRSPLPVSGGPVAAVRKPNFPEAGPIAAIRQPLTFAGSPVVAMRQPLHPISGPIQAINQPFHYNPSLTYSVRPREASSCLCCAANADGTPKEYPHENLAIQIDAYLDSQLTGVEMGIIARTDPAAYPGAGGDANLDGYMVALIPDGASSVDIELRSYTDAGATIRVVSTATVAWTVNTSKRITFYPKDGALQVKVGDSVVIHSTENNPDNHPDEDFLICLYGRGDMTDSTGIHLAPPFRVLNLNATGAYEL